MKKLSLIFFAFLTSQVLFVVFAWLIRQDTYFKMQDEGNVYLYITPFFAVAGFLGGRTIFQSQLSGMAGKTSLKEKFAVYSSAFLIRVACMEAPTYFATIAFILTGNLVCLAIAALMIFYFLILRPTKNQVEQDMELNLQERVDWKDFSNQ